MLRIQEKPSELAFGMLSVFSDHLERKFFFLFFSFFFLSARAVCGCSFLGLQNGSS